MGQNKRTLAAKRRSNYGRKLPSRWPWNTFQAAYYALRFLSLCREWWLNVTCFLSLFSGTVLPLVSPHFKTGFVMEPISEPGETLLFPATNGYLSIFSNVDEILRAAVFSLLRIARLAR